MWVLVVCFHVLALQQTGNQPRAPRVPLQISLNKTVSINMLILGFSSAGDIIAAGGNFSLNYVTE